MPNLGGFEVVGELTDEVLNDILLGAWDNDIIPHATPIPAGTAFGPYALADGEVAIPRAGLSLVMDVPVNGVRITLPLTIQVHIDNPPVPSASSFDLAADVFASVPIGVLPGTIQVAALLNNIPAANVSATLTSGNPVPALTLDLIREYVHARYEDGTIPHEQTDEDVSFSIWTGDAFLEIFDDESNPALQIEVTQPLPDQVKLRLPFHLRLSNLAGSFDPQPLSPMGITGRIAITTSLTSAPGSLTVGLSTATVDIEDIAPAAGVEGTNYNLNKTGASFMGLDLEQLFRTEMIARAQPIVACLGDPAHGGNMVFTVPTTAQIEAFIAAQAHAAIIGRGDISLWTPTPPASGEVTVTDVRTLALPDAMAICLNNPAGDTSVLHNFIPAGQSCVIALDGARVIALINEQISEEYGSLPSTREFEGHTVVIESINPSLQDGYILLQGEVSVKEAIPCVDVNNIEYSVHVGLRWIDNPEGGQTLEPYVIGDPDIDLPDWLWVLGFLMLFLVELIIGIILVVVAAIAEDIAEDIGSSIVRDEITGQVQAIQPWPQTLDQIGEVETRFETDVLIDRFSVVFVDLYQVNATYASTVIAFAEANGPYLVNAGEPVTFTGGPVTVDTDYAWDFGDGATAAGRVAAHTYADNGVYVAKLTTTVNQPGGVVTRQFAVVRARNVPPVVDAGPDLTIDEGQEVEFKASFTDQEWPDTHTAIFDFGDDSLPVAGLVTETNNPPRAEGTATARHAYCDNGEYTVTVKVTDDNGGIGLDQLKVLVRNVPPTVEAGDDRFAYPGFPISLEACFIDPGWCDSHTATWLFGDDSRLTPGVVSETNDPPQGAGSAAAVHVYQNCGTYLAQVAVTDDDGGTGRDFLHIHVVTLRNVGFEEGFRQRRVGQVANDWEPYGDEKTERPSFSADGAGLIFQAEEFNVHGGQRSQKICGAGKFRAGIGQAIGANPGWDYQVSVWYHLDERGGGVCRLGLDPDGGVNPDSPSVVWKEGHEHRHWAQLLSRVTAREKRLTIFLETRSDREQVAGYFDDVLFIPYPSQVEACQPEPEEPPAEEQRACVDWKDENEPQTLPESYHKGGFTFESLSGKQLHIVFWGDPINAGKLMFQEKGMKIQLPFEANRVEAHVSKGTSQPITLDAFGPDGGHVGQAISSTGQHTVEALEISAEKMASLVVSGGGGEGILVDLCAFWLPK